jgi:hypothetical protein
MGDTDESAFLSSSSSHFWQNERPEEENMASSCMPVWHAAIASNRSPKLFNLDNCELNLKHSVSTYTTLLRLCRDNRDIEGIVSKNSELT